MTILRWTLVVAVCICIVDDVIVLWTVNTWIQQNTTTTATTTYKTESRVDPTKLPDVSECIGLLKLRDMSICALFSHLSCKWKTQTSNLCEFVKSDEGSSTRNKSLLIISYPDKDKSKSVKKKKYIEKSTKACGNFRPILFPRSS